VVLHLLLAQSAESNISNAMLANHHVHDVYRTGYSANIYRLAEADARNPEMKPHINVLQFRKIRPMLVLVIILGSILLMHF
jgi:hypothetical protein